MMRFVGGAALTVAGMTLMAGPAAAQEARDPGPRAPVSYQIGFDNAVHHEAQVRVTYRNLRPGPVEFRMARSSPGRYALHEFAKNVYSVSATDGTGKPLAITRTDPYSWIVETHGDTVTVAYTLFGDRGDGTYAQIDPTHAHLNMPATFLWAVGYDERPIRVTFDLKPKWKVATQLPQVAGSSSTFWAPHLQYFMDSPTELSDFKLREWQQPGAGGKSYTMRLAVHSLDTDADVDVFAGKVRRTIAEHFQLFGGPPAFDFGSYTFIADYMPQIDGDGMEHRNSTFISAPASLRQANFRQLDTASHEFTHTWNVERLRPAELEPFDFTRANATPSLWVAEGFTQYYGPLMIRRAGESSTDEFLAGLGRTLSGIVNSPARRYGGPQEMSLRAPFSDAATAIDPTNGNTTVSYYPYGAVLGLALDLTLRERYGSSLDALMRALWQSHGRVQANYAPARPYTQADVEAALAGVTRDPAFAKAFFDASVRGSALPDYAPLLAPAGLLLRPARPGAGWLGAMRVAPENGALTLAQIPVTGSPLHAAGLDKGDTLVSLNGTPLAAAADWTAAVAAVKPGQKVAVVWRNRGGEQRATMTAVADPLLEVVRVETAGGTLTPQQAAFRDAWLGK